MKFNAILVPLAVGLAAPLFAAGCSKCSGKSADPSGAPSSSPSAVSSVPARPPAREALFWDFSMPDEPTLLSLWPPDSSAPKASAPGIRTTNEQGSAVVVVEGTNPHAEWTFNPPLKAGLFSLEVDSTSVAKLEVSWRSKDCPARVDACSASEMLGIGREFVEFVLPVSQITAIRVGFPEQTGFRLVMHRMRFIAKPKATGGWRGSGGDVHLHAVPQGLQIACDKPDPSIALQVAALEAELVDSVELDVGVGEFQPQIFWHGKECPHFSEECSVRLQPSDAAAGRFTATVAGHPRWTGRVEGLRVDPGDAAGVYVVKRLALLRKTPLLSAQ